MESIEPESLGRRYGDDVFDAVIALISQGMSIRRAALACGVSPSTADRWAGQSRAGKSHGANGRPPHPGRERFRQLREQGISVPQASAQVGLTRSSGYRWDRELSAADASASTRSAGKSQAYNQRMGVHQLLASTDTNPRFLTLAEREKICDLRSAGLSVRAIAAELGRPHSTVSREIARNSDAVGRYLPYGAQHMASRRRARPKQPKLAEQSRLRSWIQDKLDLRWSPKQISATLVKEFPEDQEMRVCTETIYQALYLQARGGLKKEIQAALRTGRTRRKPQGAQRKPRILGENMLMISERPAEVEDRAVPGHWEGDLIIGADSRSAIATLVERHTRYVMLAHLSGDHRAETVAEALTKKMKTLPPHLRGSLTWDQGSEMALHHKITIAADLPIYFCDPASPWQRGSNENTNGLLRQYFPKGTDLSLHSPEDLEHVAQQLNGRPRETLNWSTPAEKMRALILTS